MNKFLERKKLLKPFKHCESVINILTNKTLGHEELTVSSTGRLSKK